MILIDRQLLLSDFTVVKIMLSAFVAGMIGINAMKALGLIARPLSRAPWGRTLSGV